MQKNDRSNELIFENVFASGQTEVKRWKDERPVAKTEGHHSIGCNP